MTNKGVEDVKLKMSELDEGLIIMASQAAEQLGIPLPLFVNQALQEKLLRLIGTQDGGGTERDPKALTHT